MIHKATFLTDTEENTFFQANSRNGESTIYIIKVIILHNPIEHRQERHLYYSDKTTMKAGMHMRKGVPQQ